MTSSQMGYKAIFTEDVQKLPRTPQIWRWCAGYIIADDLQGHQSGASRSDSYLNGTFLKLFQLTQIDILYRGFEVLPAMPMPPKLDPRLCLSRHEYQPLRTITRACKVRLQG